MKYCVILIKKKWDRDMMDNNGNQIKREKERQLANRNGKYIRMREILCNRNKK